jgi:hypothetical protein
MVLRKLALASLAGASSATVLFSADCAGAGTGTGECIYSMDVDALNVKANLTAELAYASSGKISALEVDVPHSKIYWTDRTNEVLMGATLGADFADAMVLASGMGEPHDVSARLSTGAVYFADKVKGTVEFSADYGATHQTFASDLEEPVGVEVDDDNARLYVGDYKAGAIWAYDLDKPGFRVPFQANCTQPRSILLNDGYVYWIEVGGSDPDSVAAGAVYRQPAGQFGGAKALFASGFVDPDALAVIEDTLLITDESSGFITHAAFDADGVVYAADYQLVKAAAPRAIASFTFVDVDASGAWAQLAAVAAGASAASLPVGGLLGVLAVGLLAAKAASKKQAAYEPVADAEV